MKKILPFVAFLLIGFTTVAQVGIGNIDPNATLDISASNVATPSNDDGLLIPRIDEFPSTNPTSAQDGMMVFVTGNGTPAKGFYYWDEDAGPAAWVAVTGGSGGTLDEAYDFGGAGAGRIITADNGAVQIAGDDGLVVNGTVNAFDLNNGVSGVFSSLAAPSTLGVNSNGTIASHDAMTLYNNTTSSTLARGIYSDFRGDFTGDVDAIENRFLYTGAANVSGFKNSFNAYGNSNLIGLENSFDPVNGSLTTGNLIGVNNYFDNQVNTSGTTTGVLNQVLSGGNGIKYGVFTGIIGSGTGNLYGSYNTISALGSGIGYGVYSQALGNTNYAGYFIGRTELGDTASDRYLMPPADGTAGQVMTTNGSGTVTFEDASGDADWYEADTSSSPTSNASEIFTNGNVGIGISNPDNPLHIGTTTSFDLDHANAGQDGIFIIGGGDNSGINAVGGSISFGPPSSTRAAQRKSAIASVQTGSDIDFTGLGFYVHGNPINQSPMIEGMRLTHNRQLGINNNAPSATLDVIGTMQFEDGNEAAGYVLASDASGNATWTDPNTLVTGDTDWTTVGGDIERQSGDVYVGDDAATDNDMYLSDRIIDWDDNTYFVDPASENRINEITFDAGTATDPSIHFDADTNTGFYRPELDAIGFTSNGAGKLSFSAKGQIEFFNTGNSVFLGSQAGDVDDLSDNQNVGIGNFALLRNTTGNANVALGYLALRTNVDGASNVGVGYGTLFANSSGNFNVAMGRSALGSNIDGDYNIGIGNQALFDNESGSHNIALGNQALLDATASSNIAIGRTAGLRITSGTRNIGIGYRAQAAHLTGNDNIVIGERAMDTSTSSSSNVVMGSGALTNMTEGNNNTVIGHSALGSNTGAAPNVANNNVAIGYQAGQTSEGDGNIYIGYRAGQSDGAASNHLYIENSSADETGALIYGEFDNDILRINGEVQVGDPSTAGYSLPTNQGTAAQVLTSNGDGTTSWAATSGTTTSIVRANLTGFQNVPANTFTKLEFDSTVFDTNSDFDTTNHRYVAPRNGYYDFNASLVAIRSSGSGVVYVTVRKNGTLYQRNNSTLSTTTIHRSTNGIVQLNTGDYLEVFIGTDNSSWDVSSAGAYTIFEVKEIK